MLPTYCRFRLSVSSNFNVISFCSGLSTSFLKSKSGSRIEEGCDALFFLAIFCNCGVRVIKKISIILSMLFGLVCQFLLQVALLFHLEVYEFCCVKRFDVVCLFQNQTFLKTLV